MKSPIKVHASVATFDGKGVNKQWKKSLELLPQNQHRISGPDTCKSRQSISTIFPVTPPPSPSPKSRLRYSQRNYTENRSRIDILSDELIDMFEHAVQQCAAAETRYKRLDLTMKSTLNIQTKTYEHCIEELNNKIEKLESRSSAHTSINSDFMNSFLDGYTTTPTILPEIENGQEYSNTQDCLSTDSQENQIKELRQQIAFTEQSMQQIITQYISELENERSQTRRLKEIVDKQDNLITTLEAKYHHAIANQQHSNNQTTGSKAVITSKNEELLEAQIELQGIELEDKKRLLSMLLNERDALYQKVEQLLHLKPMASKMIDDSNLDHFKKRSSIDILAKIAHSDMPNPAVSASLKPSDLKKQKKSPSPLAFNKSHVFEDHPPPPPSPPPQNPLPPTPSSLKIMNTPPSSAPTRKFNAPKPTAVEPYPMGIKSWSYLDFANSSSRNSEANGYYNTPPSTQEKPVYRPADRSSEWRKQVVQDLHIKTYEKMIEQPPTEIHHYHTNGFSSLLKSWKRYAN